MLAIALAAVLGIAGQAQEPPVAAPQPTEAQPTSAEPVRRVVLVAIEGEIGDASVVVLRRAIREAQGAEALVLMIDTPGGKLDSAIEMSNDLLKAPCKTIAYVHGMGAISAGALIAYSCDKIVMVKGTAIGASAPVTIGGELPPEISEKTKSFLRARYRALGEAKGHNPLLGEAMVDSRVELHGYRDENGAYRIVRVRGNEPDAPPAPEHVVAPPKVPANEIEAIGEAVRSVAEELLKPEPPKPTYSQTESTFPALPDGGELIDSAEELLTLTSLDAEKLGLSRATVLGVDDTLALVQAEGAAREYISPTRAEQFYAWITSPMIAGLLFMLGLAGLYYEMKAPGFGVPGAVGLACLGLFFGAHLVLGVAEWLDLLLVVAGLVLIAVEIFVLPGLTLAGIGGLGCIVLGMYLAVTRVPIPQYEWDYLRLNDAIYTLFVALTSFMLFVALSWRFLPGSPIGRVLIQAGTQTVDAGYTVQTSDDAAHLLGREGVALSMLRPAGRAKIDGDTVDVVTRGEFIDAGARVRVTQVDGNRCVVEQARGND